MIPCRKAIAKGPLGLRLHGEGAVLKRSPGPLSDTRPEKRWARSRSARSQRCLAREEVSDA